MDGVVKIPDPPEGGHAIGEDPGPPEGGNWVTLSPALPRSAINGKTRELIFSWILAEQINFSQTWSGMAGKIRFLSPVHNCPMSF